MQMLGSNQKLDSVSIEKLEASTCILYTCKETRSIDEARYKQFCWKKKLPDPHKLPPTSDALTFHLKRANYQAFEWNQALLRDHQFIDPQGNGWNKINDSLEIEWLSQPSGPEKILDFITWSVRKLLLITMFVTSRKVSCLAQDYASVCHVKTMKLMKTLGMNMQNLRTLPMMILMKLMQNTGVKWCFSCDLWPKDSLNIISYLNIT